MKYASNNIRNILIAGHAGSGKTTLTEALVYFSGAAERMGRVEDGTTISDFDPEEAKRKASLSASVVPVEYEGIKYNLIDAPGLFDFEAGEYEGIRAAESVLVVVSGRSGVTVGAEKAFQLARKNGKATMVFVSKCDLENANYFKILEDMKIKFGSTVCPCVVPAKLDDGTPVYINLFSQKAFKYESGKQIQVDLPDIGHRFQGLIEAMSEAIAETDDELMEKYFNGDDFSDEEVLRGLKKGIADGGIVPVCSSAFQLGAGLEGLLDLLVTYVPTPLEHGPYAGFNDKNEPVERLSVVDAPVSAFVFKTIVDPFVGKISVMKVVTGKLNSGTEVYNERAGKTEKLGKLFFLRGKNQTELNYAEAGDIVAVAKLQYTLSGDTLCDKNDIIRYLPLDYPQPSYYIAIEAVDKNDEDKMGTGLNKLREEDPSFVVERNTETRQTLLGGQGDIQLGVILAKLKDRFGVKVKTVPQKIAYRETIKGTSDVQGKHKKQSGGAGQYGDVHIRFSPSEKEFEFSEELFGGSVPKNYVPAVEKGLLECMDKGPLAGCKVVNVKAVLYDGSYHDVDSNEMAFKIAASLAFKKGITEAKPCLLEPIMRLEIFVPDDYMGDVMGDMNKRRGKILGMEPLADGGQKLLAEAPQAELFDYAIGLRAMTQARGSFTMKFEKYEEVPAHLSSKIIEAHKADET